MLALDALINDEGVDHKDDDGAPGPAAEAAEAGACVPFDPAEHGFKYTTIMSKRLATIVEALKDNETCVLLFTPEAVELTALYLSGSVRVHAVLSTADIFSATDLAVTNSATETESRVPLLDLAYALSHIQNFNPDEVTICNGGDGCQLVIEGRADAGNPGRAEVSCEEVGEENEESVVPDATYPVKFRVLSDALTKRVDAMSDKFTIKMECEHNRLAFLSQGLGKNLNGTISLYLPLDPGIVTRIATQEEMRTYCRTFKKEAFKRALKVAKLGTQVYLSFGSGDTTPFFLEFKFGDPEPGQRTSSIRVWTSGLCEEDTM